jgi:hypothetical protein
MLFATCLFCDLLVLFPTDPSLDLSVLASMSFAICLFCKCLLRLVMVPRLPFFKLLRTSGV